MLPLGCEAAPGCTCHFDVSGRMQGPAAQSSGSKLPRHTRSPQPQVGYLNACNASSLAITPAAVCSPSNCSRTLPRLSMM
nr:hypothetical protein C1892_26285 [Pseudomonas sp. MPBD7-1]